MMIIILRVGHGAVRFDHFSSTEENSFVFFRRPWRADLRHLMSTVRRMPTQGEQDETAFENERRARHGAVCAGFRARHGAVCAGFCIDDNACGGESERVLPPRRHFWNALLQLCDHGTMSGDVLRSRWKLLPGSIPGGHQQRLCLSTESSAFKKGT